MSEKKKSTAKKGKEKTDKTTSNQSETTATNDSENTTKATKDETGVEPTQTEQKEEVVESNTASAKQDEVKDKEEPVSEQEEITKDESQENDTAEDAAEAPSEDSNPQPRMTSSEEDVDFDWESFEKGDEEYTSSEREALEKDYLSSLNTIESDQVIDGNVVSISDREVVININYKSDGIISRNEFRYKDDFKVGDIVEVLVEKKEDKKGQLVLSHKKARIFRSWEKVNEAFDNDIVVEGHIKCRTKGGMIVEVLGLEAFLPGSQIDIKPIRDYDEYVGKKMEFKVSRI